ncbi:LOW QUALITY PROTEIN: hypothetical protein KIPB_001979, partial [Kipferlia bialata]|eukprot:g1979.t1
MSGQDGDLGRFLTSLEAGLECFVTAHDGLSSLTDRENPASLDIELNQACCKSIERFRLAIHDSCVKMQAAVQDLIGNQVLPPSASLSDIALPEMPEIVDRSLDETAVMSLTQPVPRGQDLSVSLLSTVTGGYPSTHRETLSATQRKQRVTVAPLVAVRVPVASSRPVTPLATYPPVDMNDSASKGVEAMLEQCRPALKSIFTYYSHAADNPQDGGVSVCPAVSAEEVPHVDGLAAALNRRTLTVTGFRALMADAYITDGPRQRQRETDRVAACGDEEEEERKCLGIARENAESLFSRYSRVSTVEEAVASPIATVPIKQRRKQREARLCDSMQGLSYCQLELCLVRLAEVHAAAQAEREARERENDTPEEPEGQWDGAFGLLDTYDPSRDEMAAKRDSIRTNRCLSSILSRYILVSCHRAEERETKRGVELRKVDLADYPEARQELRTHKAYISEMYLSYCKEVHPDEPCRILLLGGMMLVFSRGGLAGNVKRADVKQAFNTCIDCTDRNGVPGLSLKAFHKAIFVLAQLVYTRQASLRHNQTPALR